MSRQIESDGYPAQVPDIPGKTFVHYEDENLQRQHIYHENGSYYLKDRPEKWETQALKNLLQNEPHRFSTAVASRPVFQRLAATGCGICGRTFRDSVLGTNKENI